MPKYFSRAGLVAVTLAALLLVHLPDFGQAAGSGNPLFGTWEMDQAKSVNHRSKQNPTYTTQHTRIMTQEGDAGFRNILFNGPATSAPAYSYSAQLDGKEYPDPRARDKNQTLTHWRLAPDLIVRLQKTDGKPSEWAIYTVSSDGKVLASTSWVPTDPDLQDFQVFTRAK